MNLETRLKHIADEMNYLEDGESISSKELCKKYLKEPTSSDHLSTGQILSIMALLGLVNKHASYAGKRARYRFTLRKTIGVRNGIA